mmetsp:Transcript_999/g.1356  ORF Transcript_999/g.1356 Transcript_999/m.1356 type:complete len:280 (+) Transcript_999:265-1104(+)
MASGCSICATTNQCNIAFHNGPGQYCGDWYDYNTLTHKPCCCPLPQLGAPPTCSMTPSQCKCHIVPASQSSRYGYTHHNQPVYSPSYYPPTAYHSNWHGSYYNYYRRQDPVAPLFILLFLILCCCACGFGSRSRHNYHHPTTQEGIPIATAVDPSCHSENPAYSTKPSYTDRTWYGSTTSSSNQGGGGGGAGNVASGLGGFAIGTIVGDLIGRRGAGGGGGHRYHDQNNAPFFGGGGFFGGGNDGGYDIVGDSGNNNNNFGGGYDVQGDSGGYDIQGDS